MKQLTGIEMEDETHLMELARKLIDKGKSEVVIISLGSGGAIMVTAEDRRHLRSPTVSIKSKVGAGDSMAAGIILSLLRGNPLPDSVKFGVASGAAAVMTPGTELCRREDTEKLFEKIKLN
jgi:6-phosphofructokinase 2